MIARLTLSFAAALAAAPALADEELRFDIADTEQCLARGVEYIELRNCIGASMAACMNATPLGATTMGMNHCTQEELDWWDARLNVFYQKARAMERAEDAEMAGVANYQSQADALRDMQRAWIGFRDAKCTYELSQWTGGTGGGPAWLHCLMHETAEQALYLQVISAHY